jgi:hypothetical protein
MLWIAIGFSAGVRFVCLCICWMYASTFYFELMHFWSSLLQRLRLEVSLRSVWLAVGFPPVRGRRGLCGRRREHSASTPWTCHQDRSALALFRGQHTFQCSFTSQSWIRIYQQTLKPAKVTWTPSVSVSLLIAADHNHFLKATQTSILVMLKSLAKERGSLEVHWRHLSDTPDRHPDIRK